MAPSPTSGTSSPQLRRRLWQAATDGDLQLFKRTATALDAGKGCLKDAVETVKSRGAGVLHAAAGHGRMSVCVYVVKELLVDVNASDDAVKFDPDHMLQCNKVFNTVCTPLFVALTAGSLKCVKLLIKAGADVKGVGTVTPLITAVNNGLTDFYNCLLEAGADPDVRDDFGHLPIELAAYQNRRKDVEILLPVTSRVPYVRDWSVDGIISYVKSMPSVEDDPMRNMKPDDLKLEGNKAYKRNDYATAAKLYSMPLFYLQDYEKACDAFVDGLKLDPTNVEIEKALRTILVILSRVLVLLNRLSVTRTLHFLHTKHHGRRQQLIMAAVNSPGAPKRRLLQAAADGDLQRFKRIASVLDAGKGRVGQTVAAVKDHGAGALHIAAFPGKTALCAFLVEELHQDVNAADESGETPLVYAVRGDTVDTVQYLLDHGANPDKHDGNGSTPLHLAAAGGLSLCVLVSFICVHGRETSLTNEFLSCYLQAGADVKGVGTITPLILAVKKGLTDFYKCLLEAGADPNVRDDFGYLPIEIAANKNRRKDVEILLPVTSHVPYVHDWSVDGILSYVESMPSMELVWFKLVFTTTVYTAARHYPDDLTMFSNRSLCWLKLGEGDRALMDAQNPIVVLQPFYLQDYEKATDAFLDGLKLDPANVEIDRALWEAVNGMKESHIAKQLSAVSLAQ
ncbi:hypothetical protein HU200_043655 [Digitaria exilis]|uniref:Uncharacterized protein n=1 Tax=Digitaria exilis TaxID=1010633 RepID=A0A835EG38_9POAL|nr:hypothetical protein HU200_043655 [Digitaria exilis]